MSDIGDIQAALQQLHQPHQEIQWSPIIFRKPIRLSACYGASKGTEAQLFNVAFARGTADPRQTALWFASGSLNTAQVETNHTEVGNGQPQVTDENKEAVRHVLENSLRVSLHDAEQYTGVSKTSHSALFLAGIAYFLYKLQMGS